MYTFFFNFIHNAQSSSFKTSIHKNKKFHSTLFKFIHLNLTDEVLVYRKNLIKLIALFKVREYYQIFQFKLKMTEFITSGLNTTNLTQCEQLTPCLISFYYLISVFAFKFRDHLHLNFDK